MPADWITPGAKVVVIGGSHIHETVSATRTIDRVLKRDVVLDDGTRFSLTRASKDCIRGAARGAWDPTSDLYPEDSLRVAQARRKQLDRQIKARIANLAEVLVINVRKGEWEVARQTHADLGSILERYPGEDTDGR